MYDSGMTQSEVIAAAREGCDVFPSLGDGELARTVCGIEQFVYSNVICVTRRFTVEVSDGTVTLPSAGAGECERKPEFCDITAVRVSSPSEGGASVELRAIPAGVADIYRTASSPAYFRISSDRLGVCGTDAETVTVICRAAPKLRDATTEHNVMIPRAYIGMVIDRLRADIYSAAGDVSAAFFTDRYNAELEDFMRMYGE